MTKKERNKLLTEAYYLLDNVRDKVMEANDEEQEALANWPESLQDTDRYAEAEERAENIQNFLDDLEEFQERLCDILEQ